MGYGEEEEDEVSEEVSEEESVEENTELDEVKGELEEALFLLSKNLNLLSMK